MTAEPLIAAAAAGLWVVCTILQLRRALSLTRKPRPPADWKAVSGRPVDLSCRAAEDCQ